MGVVNKQYKNSSRELSGQTGRDIEGASLMGEMSEQPIQTGINVEEAYRVSEQPRQTKQCAEGAYKRSEQPGGTGKVAEEASQWI